MLRGEDVVINGDGETSRDFCYVTNVVEANVLAATTAFAHHSFDAEYDAAKEEQQHLELKISKLEVTLSRAKIIDARDLPNDKIYILSRVKLVDLKTNEQFEYLLVSPEESNFEANKISVTSPIGKALLGKTKGETVEIKVPVGLLTYKILDISR